VYRPDDYVLSLSYRVKIDSMCTWEKAAGQWVCVLAVDHHRGGPQSGRAQQQLDEGRHHAGSGHRLAVQVSGRRDPVPTRGGSGCSGDGGCTRNGRSPAAEGDRRLRAPVNDVFHGPRGCESADFCTLSWRSSRFARVEERHSVRSRKLPLFVGYRCGSFPVRTYRRDSKRRLSSDRTIVETRTTNRVVWRAGEGLAGADEMIDARSWRLLLSDRVKRLWPSPPPP